MNHQVCNDIELEGIVNALKAMQRNLDRLEKWTNRNLMNVYIKCQMLPLGRKHWCKGTGQCLPAWEYVWGKRPGGLGKTQVGCEPAVRAAKMASSTLEPIHQCTARTSRKRITPLSSALLRAHLNIIRTWQGLTNWTGFNSGFPSTLSAFSI